MDERGGLNVSRPERRFILRKPSPALFLPNPCTVSYSMFKVCLLVVRVV